MPPTPQSSAFVALWSAHGPRVYSYIYSLVANWSDTDDVFQETSIVLLEKFDEFQPGTNFLGWACKVAHFKALQCLEHRGRAEPVDAQLIQAIGDEQTRLLDESEPRLAALAECLKQLSGRDRQFVKLRYEGGGDVKSIAARTGRTTNVVYKSLRRIHETLLFCIRQKLTESRDS